MLPEVKLVIFCVVPNLVSVFLAGAATRQPAWGSVAEGSLLSPYGAGDRGCTPQLGREVESRMSSTQGSNSEFRRKFGELVAARSYNNCVSFSEILPLLC